jgi:hypothetical protein
MVISLILLSLLVTFCDTKAIFRSVQIPPQLVYDRGVGCRTAFLALLRATCQGNLDTWQFATALPEWPQKLAWTKHHPRMRPHGSSKAGTNRPGDMISNTQVGLGRYIWQCSVAIGKEEPIGRVTDWH